MPEQAYCTQCAFPGPRRSAYCGNCGMPRELTPKRRAGHVAFVLNELHVPPITDVVSEQQRATLAAQYGRELDAYLAPMRRPPPVPEPRPAPAPAPQPHAQAPMPQPLTQPAAATMSPPPTMAQPPRRVTPPPPPARPPMPPREPMDWSWLAEQQANLFLFAGAFLTVVAALIYVGYSGQAVGGALKMTLLIAYTLAFLAAGWFCMRIPRVEMAGRVFFGVGALLVPMNFAVAREIFGSEQDLQPETMWLAGSITAAAFYAAVAWIGVGRMYAVGAGFSLMSAAVAAPFATHTPLEWAPLLLIGVSLAMLLTQIGGDEKLRERLGFAWGLQGRALAAIALGWLAVVTFLASLSPNDSAYLDVTTLWFLPVTLAAFAAAATVPMLLTRHDEFTIPALASFGAAGVTVAFALDLPAEGWVISSTAVAAYFGLMLLFSEDERFVARLPERIGEYIFAGGIALTALAGVIAAFALTATTGDDPAYVVRERWFLAASFAFSLAFYACAGAAKRGRTGDNAYAVAIGTAVSFAGAWIATIYAFDWPVEAYAVGIAAMAPVLALAVLAAQDERIERTLPAHLIDAAYITAIAASITAAGVALLTLAASGDDVDPYDVHNRWFLPGTFALSLAGYALMSATKRAREGTDASIVSFGATISFAATWAAVIYAFDWPAEAYAVSIAAMAPVLALATIAAQDTRVAGRIPARLADATHATAVSATAVAASIALLTLLAANENTDPYDIRSRWFLPGTFAFVLASYALIAPLQRARAGADSVVVSLGAVASFAATWTGVIYAFDWPAEAYALGIAAMAPAFALALIAAQDHRIAPRLPEHLADAAFLAGIVATAAATAIAVATVGAAHTDDARDLATRWFLPGTFALALAFYAIAAPVRKAGDSALLVTAGMLTFLTGTWVATIYAFNWPAEAYAIGIAALAAALGVALAAARDARIARWLPDSLTDASYATAVVATLVSVTIAAAMMIAANEEVDPYILSTRWFLLPALALGAAFFAIDAAALRRGLGVHGFVIFLTGAAGSVVYALDVSAEYYAFALIVPAIATIAAARFAPAIADNTLGGAWRDDVVLLARITAALGMFAAFMAAMVGSDPSLEWTPQSQAFLPVAFLAAAIVFGIDASRGGRIETSLAFAASLGAAAIATPYAFDAQAAYYGVALVAAGIIYAASDRIYTPSWLDVRARDGLAVLGVAAATIPFVPAYGDLPRLGAAVHIAAACFFAAAALDRRSSRTLADFVSAESASKIRLSIGWLYPAGLFAAIGYIFVLRSLAPDTNVEGGTLAMPMLTISIALMLHGVAAKFRLPEFRLHFYAMSLVAALVSLATAADAETLALLLTVYTVAYIIIAAIENAPALGAPSVIFGFIAVPVWRAHLDESYGVLPLAYSLTAIAAYAGALALRAQLPRWAMALRATGAAFALVAPAAGFGVLSALNDSGRIDGQRFEQTALYQLSTLAVAAVGALALVESLLARRRWIIVPASGVIAGALLLQIGSMRPENIQAYTAVVGAYLVLLGIAGISRMKLIPQLGDYAIYIEALGAVTIMLPSFAQSIDAGWRYQWILLIESVLFLAGGIVLRRRGVLSAGALFLVLVSGRLLLDALYAMPNWIVVALCGIALLGVGVGILLGRERWDAWQKTIIGWWSETDTDEDAALVH